MAGKENHLEATPLSLYIAYRLSMTAVSAVFMQQVAMPCSELRCSNYGYLPLQRSTHPTNSFPPHQRGFILTIRGNIYVRLVTVPLFTRERKSDTTAIGGRTPLQIKASDRRKEKPNLQLWS